MAAAATDVADHLHEQLVLDDRRRVLLRPLDPTDEDAYREFGSHLSATSIYYRFFTPRNTMSEQEVDHFLHVDQVNRYAIVAIDVDTAAIVGVGRYDHSAGTDEAEVAFIVADEYQGKGIATRMLTLLGAAARRAGIARLVASVLPDNHKMMAVFEASEWLADRHFEDGVLQVQLDL